MRGQVLLYAMRGELMAVVWSIQTVWERQHDIYVSGLSVYQQPSVYRQPSALAIYKLQPQPLDVAELVV